MAGQRGYSATQLTAKAHVFTLQSGASPAAAYLVEARFGGFSTNVTVTRDRLIFRRSSGGVTPTNATEDERQSRSPSPAGNIVTAWTTAPTLTGSALLILENGLRQGYARVGRMWTPPRASAVPILYDAEQADSTNADTGGSPAYTLFFEEHPPLFLVRPDRRPRSSGGWNYSAMQSAPGLTNSIGINNNVRQAWTGTVQQMRSFARGVQNWLSFYGAAAAPEDRLAPTAVVGAPFPSMMEV